MIFVRFDGDQMISFAGQADDSINKLIPLTVILTINLLIFDNSHINI